MTSTYLAFVAVAAVAMVAPGPDTILGQVVEDRPERLGQRYTYAVSGLTPGALVLAVLVGSVLAVRTKRGRR